MIAIEKEQMKNVQQQIRLAINFIRGESNHLLILIFFQKCVEHIIQHRDDSGIFFLKGSSNDCRAVYRVTFNGNIAIATGGTVEPISVALTINGEALGNATATLSLSIYSR